MFRLREQFSECVPVFLIDLSGFTDRESSLSVYTGDSYGNRSYIDTYMPRACSMQCRCRSLASKSFAFEVRKTADDINVKLYSTTLQMELLPLLVPEEEFPRRHSDIISGFHLLKSSNYLESRLRRLRAKRHYGLASNYFPGTDDWFEYVKFEAELSLLVEGLVADDQVFDSFGYQTLYKKGFLTFDRLISFQSSKMSRTLAQLVRAFLTIDQSEGDEDFNEMSSDNIADILQASHPMPSVPSLGVIRPQYEIGGPVNDRNSPLIAAIYMGRNDVIAELLARHENPMILSHINQEDRWLVAKSLLDHGVNATSLFESIRSFERVEPRLLYVLMEKGAEIYSSSPTSTQGLPSQGLHVSDHEIQEANSMHAYNFQLLSAIQRGDLRCAEDQISHGADPTFGIDSALVCRQWDILRLLLQKGADPKVLEFGKPRVHLQEDVKADACLLTVAEEGLTTVVKSLLHLRRCNKMVAEDLRRPSLTKLIQYDRTPILRMLFEKGVFSRDYLAGSSGWSLPLAAETSMHLFTLLLSFGARASTALIAAVIDRNLTSVILLLNAMEKSSVRNIINTLRVHGPMTLLMKAVHDGSVEIAQQLMDYGADPYNPTEYGNSFTIAEEKGFKGLHQMLRRGIRTSYPMLKNWGDFAQNSALPREPKYQTRTLRPFPLDDYGWDEWDEWWNPVRGEDSLVRDPMKTAITRRQKLRRPNIPTVREDCLNTIKIRCLHREFRRHHAHIFACARVSIDLGWSPLRKEPHCPAWGDVFDCNHSKAWSRGIAVMRGLCRGEAPSTLYDTIMFLAIGKAICHSKIASSIPDHHAEFLADLGRWQVLFDSDERSLSAFRDAVTHIWHVSAEELERAHSPDSTSLIHFQELAMSLITNVEQSFDGERHLDKGLLASQERWASTIVPEMSETQRPEPFDMQFPENTVERGKLSESDTPDPAASGVTYIPQSPEKKIPLRDAIHNDSRLRTCSTTVVLLMAGFVFSVVLVFLKGTSLESGLI